ncbi:MAG: hypothetical protein ACLRWH_03210 [Emergencia sp.]
MGQFQREDSIYSIPQTFADKTIKKCPFCKTWEPGWLVQTEWKLLGGDYRFKCPHCGSILRASQADVSGLSFTTASFQGQWKKYKGKENRKVYFTIEKIDLSVKNQKNMIYEGSEVTLEELAAIAREEN